MVELNKDDIIIKIADYLKLIATTPATSAPFSVEYAAVDNSQKLPAGSTAKYIDEAAKDADLEIIRKGATMVSFGPKRKRPVIA